MIAITEAALIIVPALVALWRVRIHLKRKAKRFEENKKAAWIALQTASGVLPSWAKNDDKLSEFLFAVQRQALREGVPHRKILETLATEHVFIQLISFAGALEIRKVSLSDQQLAVAETIFQRFEYDERMRAEAEVFFSN